MLDIKEFNNTMWGWGVRNRGEKMLNARRVDDKFFISGGWQDIERDTEWLKMENIRAVLDMQYVPYDSANLPYFVKSYLADEGIEYLSIPMYDGEMNENLAELYTLGENTLEDWDKRFTHKRDRILVKCAAGISRSVSQYLNYICKRDGLTYWRAESEFSKREAKWAMSYGDRDFWPGGPGPWFTHFLTKKYINNGPQGSAFGDVE